MKVKAAWQLRVGSVGLGPEAGRLVLGWQWPARALLDSEETAGEWAQLCQRWQFGRQLTTDLELVDPSRRHYQVGSLAGAAHLLNDNAGVLRLSIDPLEVFHHVKNWEED
eukprot:gene3595-biopygen64